MKCPHCEYSDSKIVGGGKEGCFYKVIFDTKEIDKIYMYRHQKEGVDVRELVGCPRCKKVFIN